MKARYIFTLTAGLCLLLTACVTTSVNPLSSPDTAKPDSRLVGDWRNKSKTDLNTYRITPAKGAWMHVETISNKKDDNKESYDLFPTVIGANTYLNVQTTSKDDQGNVTKSFVFYRYTLSGDKLQMWMISQDVAAEAVRSGKLKGTIHQDKNPLMVGKTPHPDVDVVLQGSSESLYSFIQNADVNKLFSVKSDPFYRIKTSAK